MLVVSVSLCVVFVIPPYVVQDGILSVLFIVCMYVCMVTDLLVRALPIGVNFCMVV